MFGHTEIKIVCYDFNFFYFIFIYLRVVNKLDFAN